MPKLKNGPNRAVGSLTANGYNTYLVKHFGYYTFSVHAKRRLFSLITTFNFKTVSLHYTPKLERSMQGRRFLWPFLKFESIIFSFIVALCDLVHDVNSKQFLL